MEPTTVPTYLLGLDLGKKRDYSALVVLEQTPVPTGRAITTPAGFDLLHGTTYDVAPETEHRYELIHVDRWRGQNYRTVPPAVQRVTQGLWQRANAGFLAAGGRHAIDPDMHLLVDQTGVGVAVVDDLRANGLGCIGVTIHGGDRVSRAGQDVRVPKRELVGVLQVLLQADRLAIPDAETVPLAGVLVEELENFRAKITLATGHDVYGAVAPRLARAHDDLVLALAMACWFGEYDQGAVLQAPSGALRDHLAAQGYR